MYADEVSNEDLASEDLSQAALVMESARVDDVIQRNVLTGADCSYFIKRERILHALTKEV